VLLEKAVLTQQAIEEVFQSIWSPLHDNPQQSLWFPAEFNRGIQDIGPQLDQMKSRQKDADITRYVASMFKFGKKTN